MPELPDIVYIKNKLCDSLVGATITDIEVTNSIVLRMIIEKKFEEALKGQSFGDIFYNGPFLNMLLTDYELVIHFMLTGRFQYIPKGSRPLKDRCFSLHLNNDYSLHYIDNKSMGKVYVTDPGRYDDIPGYLTQGVDIESKDFTLERLQSILSKSRKQIRALLVDKEKISAIGNAYADKILFDAKIFPKTPSNKLTKEEQERVFISIKKIMQWGIDEVKRQDKPIHEKVRGHMRVRNRKNQPCPVCGTTIRRANVLGWDVFYCPKCQPPGDGQGTFPW